MGFSLTAHSTQHSARCDCGQAVKVKHMTGVCAAVQKLLKNDVDGLRETQATLQEQRICLPPFLMLKMQAALK